MTIPRGFARVMTKFICFSDTKKACEVPQQNQYSHYKCDENGDLKCLPGMEIF